MSYTYPVNEIFQSIQGEATFTGTPSIFIRLQGCPVGCHWCDTKHTWEIDQNASVHIPIMLEKKEDSNSYSDMTVAELLGVIKSFHAQHIVLTGGEPCLHNLLPLTTTLYEQGYSVQIETSGTHEIKSHASCFITISPKLDMAGGMALLRSCLALADEIKYPVGKLEDVVKLENQVLAHAICSNIWLQPLSQSKKATDLCIEQATINNWKVSIQTHKFLGVR